MRNFLKFMLVVCIIVVVCLLGYAGKYFKEDSEQANANANNENKNVTSSNENNVNTTVNNKEVVEENKENEQTEEVEDPVNEENSISNEDKAIELAKKEYGDSNDVYFRIEQIQSNGVYIVSVRDNETTKDLAWYTVDVLNETVK